VVFILTLAIDQNKILKLTTMVLIIRKVILFM